MREIRPHTTLQSYASAAPKGYQAFLQKFIEDERQADISSTRDRIQESIIDEIERNDDIPFIRKTSPHFLSKSSNVLIRADPGNESANHYIRRKFDIRAGDTVSVLCYEEVNEQDFTEYLATVSKVNHESLTVELDIKNRERSSARNAIETAEYVGVARVHSPVVFNREERALAYLPDHSSSLWEVVTGKRNPKFEATDHENSEQFDELLYGNQKQRTAIRKSLTASDVCCIQGPPGTGKTRVIVEMARRFADAGNTVLVTTETNTALDNILMGSGERPAETSLLGRVGNFGSSQKVAVRRNNHQRSGREYIRNNAGRASHHSQIMLSTNNSAEWLLDQGREYDVLICDEAAQARKTSAFIPMQLADRAVFVGDHKQLAATRQSSTLNDTVDRRHESVFTHLYGGLYPESIGVQLDTQFRMVRELNEFSNQQFYDGSIKTNVSHEFPTSQPIGLINIDVAEGERSADTSKQNQLEATAAAAQVQNLLNRYYTPDEIGVIAAYSAQEELIRWQMENLSGSDTDQVQVATIDRFQGTEKKAIVVSFTRSNERSNVGFLSGEDGPNRLNVALTRAQEYCALIGDWDTLREGNPLYDDLYHSVISRFNSRSYTKEELEKLAGMLARQ